MLALGLVSWLAAAHHVASFAREWGLFVRGCASALFDAGLVWLLYMALEPFIRWRWPDSIVGWTRLLGGGYRDPLVGRDILIGSLFGAGMTLIWRSRTFFEKIFASSCRSLRPGHRGTEGSGWLIRA
jgi:serine/threonine-protein kinase